MPIQDALIRHASLALLIRLGRLIDKHFDDLHHFTNEIEKPNFFLLKKFLLFLHIFLVVQNFNIALKKAV